MPDLDVSRYDQLVAHTAMLGYANMCQLVDATEGRAWDVDQVAGTLTIAGLATYRAHMLGTYSKESETFLWSWANSGSSQHEAATGLAKQLKQHATSNPGLDVFTAPQLAKGFVNPVELGCVAASMTKTVLYQADYGAGIALLLVEVDTTPIPTAQFARIISDFQQYTFMGISACVHGFFLANGFEVEVEEHAITGTRNTSKLTVRFDEQGRVQAVQGQL